MPLPACYYCHSVPCSAESAAADSNFAGIVSICETGTAVFSAVDQGTGCEPYVCTVLLLPQWGCLSDISPLDARLSSASLEIRLRIPGSPT